MSSARKRFIAPVLMVALGISWLLNVSNVLPRVDWVWVICLAVVGILTLTIGSINKLTVVIGPFFIIASICAFFRYLGKLNVDKEIPILTIVLGILMLLVQMVKLPQSKLIGDGDEDRVKKA